MCLAAEKSKIDTLMATSKVTVLAPVNPEAPLKYTVSPTEGTVTPAVPPEVCDQLDIDDHEPVPPIQ